MKHCLTDRARTSLHCLLLLAAGVAYPLAAAHRCHGQQAQPHFRITGIVVNDRDGSPLPRCRVTASASAASRGQNREMVERQSDEHGRFALEVPAAGNWRLAVSGRNLHQQNYEAHDGFFTGIVLTAAHPTYEVVFRARPDAVLGGFVLDEAGEAVRNAPVFLVGVDAAAAETGTNQNARAQQAATDDRGHYEFSGLDAGTYLVNVRARPWYVAQGAGASLNGASPDPSLDVVYPVTWYPGTTDDASATPLVVRAGDRAEADFHLLPIPSAHLLLPSPAPAQAARPGGFGAGGFRGNAQVSLLLPNGGMQQVFGTYASVSNGEIDMSGLAPGTYQVTLPGSGPGDPGRTTVLKIAAGGSVTDVGAGVADSVLTLSVDGDATVDATQVALIDTATRRTIFPVGRRGRPGNFGPGNFNPEGFGGQGPLRRGQDAGSGVGAVAGGGNQRNPATPAATAGTRTGTGGDTLRTVGQAVTPKDQARSPVTVQLPAGRYEVTVPGNSGTFLTGLTATGAQAEGRFVTVREGDASLVVHLASGLASVEGIATFHGKPAGGALVLMIPATLGSSTSMATVRRDQSNTDGSFHLTGVVPGQYILLAIDHGWGVHWEDAATLRGYLLQGLPLEVGAGAALHSALQATAP